MPLFITSGHCIGRRAGLQRKSILGLGVKLSDFMRLWRRWEPLQLMPIVVAVGRRWIVFSIQKFERFHFEIFRIFRKELRCAGYINRQTEAM